MRQNILAKIREIEHTEGVKILHAVESGSRAWGFASPDSDYDVRFIYVHPLAWYLQLGKTRDVLEYPVDPVWDVNGWDLQKALRLLHGSNPTLYEWLNSPVVYDTTPFVEELRAAGARCYRKRAGLNHYLNMARNNWETHLQADTVQAKKYLYVLRPLLACRWILAQGTPPPVLFQELANAWLPSELRYPVTELLAQKRQMSESGRITHILQLDRFMVRELQEIGDGILSLPKEQEPDWRPLNTLFLNILNGER